MKRAILTILFAGVLLLCLFLSGCASPIARTANPMLAATATLAPDTDPVLPQARDHQLQHTRESATLFFRLGTEPYLAAETRAIVQSASQSYELALLTQLLAGPGTQNTELRGLFPEGTRVLSTVRQGRTLFVTLSQEIMNAYPDEPDDWRASDAWRIEAPLRRRLCMQSLVATVTENCDVDQVQLLVQQPSGAVGSLRLKQSYFLDGSDDTVLVGPMIRDDSLLLGPDGALDAILSCWRDQDWQRLSLYLTDRAQQGASQRNITAVMEQAVRIVSWQSSRPSISSDGSCATFAVDFTLLENDGRLTQVRGRTLRLYREHGLWKTSIGQLTGWLEN